MLAAFLNGVRHHLKPNGEAWLIISDLAEHLHLRDKDFLNQSFQTASLNVVDILKTKPQHKKATDESDPLAFARNYLSIPFESDIKSRPSEHSDGL